MNKFCMGDKYLVRVHGSSLTAFICGYKISVYVDEGSQRVEAVLERDGEILETWGFEWPKGADIDEALEYGLESTIRLAFDEGKIKLWGLYEVAKEGYSTLLAIEEIEPEGLMIYGKERKPLEEMQQDWGWTELKVFKVDPEDLSPTWI